MINKSGENVKIIDFFCGIGGLTHGLIKAVLTLLPVLTMMKDADSPMKKITRAPLLFLKK